jgi:hypothetical protein
MKTKLLYSVFFYLLFLSISAQTFEKSIDANNQMHFHDLNTAPLDDGSTDLVISSNLFDASMTTYTPVLKRVDQNGAVVWIKEYSATGFQNLRFFDVVSIFDMIVVTGSVDVAGTKKAFIARINAATGVMMSSQYFEIVSPNFNATGIHIIYTESDIDADTIPDPGYVIGGFFSDSYAVNSLASNFGFVIRTDMALNLYWTIEIDSASGTTDYDFVNHITETSDGYFLAGSANEGAKQGILARKIDFTGASLWDSSYSGGNSRDISVDAYYDSFSDQIYMLNNYSQAHFFGITSLNNTTGVINTAETWIGSSSEFDIYGFTLMESVSNPNNLVITGYDSFEAWVDTAGNSLTGQSNLFVYEFEKATGNQVVINYQYLVPHMEPIGDEYNFWNSQFPLLYFPDISFIPSIPGALNYFHIDYRTNSGVNFTEANMIQTSNNKLNECENKELDINTNGVVITSTNAILGSTPNTQNNLVISEAAIGNLIRDCQGVLSNIDNPLDKSFIYPNPANDYVFINTKVVFYTIKDALGRTIKTSTFGNENSIYLGDLSIGLYFVTFTADNGKLKTFKIIKE